MGRSRNFLYSQDASRPFCSHRRHGAGGVRRAKWISITASSHHGYITAWRRISTFNGSWLSLSCQLVILVSLEKKRHHGWRDENGSKFVQSLNCRFFLKSPVKCIFSYIIFLSITNYLCTMKEQISRIAWTLVLFVWITLIIYISGPIFLCPLFFHYFSICIQPNVCVICFSQFLLFFLYAGFCVHSDKLF